MQKALGILGGAAAAGTLAWFSGPRRWRAGDRRAHPKGDGSRHTIRGPRPTRLAVLDARSRASLLPGRASGRQASRRTTRIVQMGEFRSRETAGHLGGMAILRGHEACQHQPAGLHMGRANPHGTNRQRLGPGCLRVRPRVDARRPFRRDSRRLGRRRRRASGRSAQRYLAESVWLPTALLPSERLSWSAIDASHARATLQDGPVTVSLDFEIGLGGEILAVKAPSRARASSKGRYDRCRGAAGTAVRRAGRDASAARVRGLLGCGREGTAILPGRNIEIVYDPWRTRTAAPFKAPDRSRANPSSARASGNVDRDTKRQSRHKPEKLLAILPGEVRHRADDPLAPEQVVGEGRNRTHMNAGAHHRPAFDDRRERPWDQRPDGRKENGGVERLRRARAGIAGPCRTELSRERLTVRVAGAGEREHPPALVPSHLRHQVAGRAEAVDPSRAASPAARRERYPMRPAQSRGAASTSGTPAGSEKQNRSSATVYSA